MDEPYLGEIKLFAYEKAPKGWHACDGTLLLIQQNSALYSLLGTAFGGDGKTTFALPDMRGRVPVAATAPASNPPPPKGAYSVGLAGGEEAVTLDLAAMPIHQHTLQVSSKAGSGTSLAGMIYAAVPAADHANLYAPISSQPVAIEPTTVVSTGFSQPHNNMQPFLALCFCIATIGIYPPRP